MERNDAIMVSICCRSYNRERLIRDALDSFLMQQADFPYEIIVLDDASTDGTQEVLREYAERYPGHVRPIFQAENFYTKTGICPATPLFSAARGKYIAECDDDDYWTDPLKLWKQVEFLEANPEFVLCYHDFLFHWTARDTFEIPSLDKPRDYSPLELIGYSGTGYTIHPSTRMWRNIYTAENSHDFAVCWDDYSLNAMLGLYGGCKFIEGIRPSIYRRHDGNIWGGLSLQQKKQFHDDANKRIYEFMAARGNPEHIAIRRAFLEGNGP